MSALVGKNGLLTGLFPNAEDRPTTRWLENKMAKGLIPYIRIGRMVWFDPEQVREAIATRHTVIPKRCRAKAA